MQIPQIYLTLCCGRTLLCCCFNGKILMSSSCVAILPSLIFLREKGLFSELLAAMLSSVIRKERCAHVPYFCLEIKYRRRKYLWKGPFDVWNCQMKRTAMAFLNWCTFFGWFGIEKAGHVAKQRWRKFVNGKLKRKKELALAHLESNFWGLKCTRGTLHYYYPQDFGYFFSGDLYLFFACNLRWRTPYLTLKVGNIRNGAKARNILLVQRFHLRRR